MYIEMFYCCFELFKVFVKNYLKFELYFFFEFIERLLEEINMVFVDVVENLMFRFFNVSVNDCLENLI